eukprot:sb/3473217/
MSPITATEMNVMIQELGKVKEERHVVDRVRAANISVTANRFLSCMLDLCASEVTCEPWAASWRYGGKGHMMLDFRHNCYKANSTFRTSYWVPRTTRKMPKAKKPKFDVGVGAGIKSLSHLVNWSRDKTENTKMISVLELVRVGARIKSLSHLVN